MVLIGEANYLAVLTASVALFIIGWLWYGPIFGKTWMRLNKIGAKEMAVAKKKSMLGMMFMNFIGTLIMVCVLSNLMLNVGAGGVSEALQLAFWVWLGFFASTTLLGSVLWDNKPWGLFFLNGAYWLVSLEVAALILVWWP